MQPQHTLFVCTTCASVWKDGKRIGTSGGEKLLEEISQLYQKWEKSERFSLQPVECMSACSHPCTVSFTAPGKFTYLFGDLPVNESAAAAILECASLYYTKPDGLLPWAERPQLLKKGILAKIPPSPAYSL